LGKWSGLRGLPPNARRHLHAVRGHWGVESMHWTLDMTFGEDRCTVRQRTAAPLDISFGLLQKLKLLSFQLVMRRPWCFPAMDKQTDDFILGLEKVLTRQDGKKVVIMGFSDIFRHEGKQLGLKEGLEKGKLEKAVEIARNMPRKSMPVAAVAELAQLSRRKLAALRKA
ncbi:MAG: hypothetical protein AAF471_06150, partial [Myxococcota bacterium]